MEHVKKNNVVAAAAIVMSSVVVSRTTGFIREMLIPAKFGVDKVSDAYNIAFLVPDLMFTLLVGGSISAALVPVLSGYIQKDEEKQGWKAVSNFVNFITICMIIGSILGMIFAPQLLGVFAPGYSSKRPELVEVTVRMMRVLFPSVTFLMLAGMCTGVLNSYKRFAASAFGPTVYNVFCILSIFLLSNNNPKDYYGAYRAAYGVMISAFIYFLFQFSFAVKHVNNYSFSLDIKESGFRRLILLAIPSLISSSVMQINTIISAGFASQFSAGQVTALRMADRTWQMPLGVIAQAVGIAILPTLSGFLAIGLIEEYKSTLMKSLKSVLLLSMPAAVAFIVLSKTIIRTLFQFSGKVDEKSIALTAGILGLFAIALTTQSIATILNRGFYAANDTKTPLFIGLGTILSNIGLSFLFFYTTNLGVRGMALSYAIASIINATLLTLVLNEKMRGIHLRDLFKFIVRIVPSCLFMALVLLVLRNYLPDTVIGIKYSFSVKIIQLLLLSLQLGVGITVYFICAVLLKVEEAEKFVEIFRKKVLARFTIL